MPSAAVAIGIFIVAYALIALERQPKTLVALAGGLLLILLGILDQEIAFEAIDFNVIFLLAGMMIIANLTARSGVFQWAAIRAAKIAGGEPVRILLLIGLVTAAASAVLDNVTTAVLIVPVTLSLADTMRVNPVPYLLAVIFASNIGGTATLIGDPPNILIGSAADLSFFAFIANLAPAVIIILVVIGFGAWLYYRNRLTGSDEARQLVVNLDEKLIISDQQLLRRSLIVLGGTLIGFLAHQTLHLEPATIALSGAVVLLLWTGYPLHEALADIEWNTLFFFIGLFMLVEGLVYTGVIENLAEIAVEQTEGDLALAAMLLLVVSAVASAIVDNVPYTATMIPFVDTLGASMPDSEPLWWSLALGACLGGNATPIGAAANVLVIGIAERAGYPISFRYFLVYGIPVTLVSILISMLYVWLRYL